MNVVVSGYFDPIHKGHLDLFEAAKKLGDTLIVIINNDEQAIAKKGYVFMPAEDRARIVSSLNVVDHAVISIDEDRTVCKTLESIEPVDIFANGGDRFFDDVPEVEVCSRNGIEMVFNVGGLKSESSSELVKRVWGQWNVLEVGDGFKVKLLEVLPHKELSYQRHAKRSEHWVVVKGVATVKSYKSERTIETNESFYIKRMAWHQLINNTDDILQVIEVSTGEYIEEDDIERLNITRS